MPWGRLGVAQSEIGFPFLFHEVPYELYDDSALGPFPSDWYARDGRVVLTGEYGGKGGFRHVLAGLGVAVADGEEDLVFSLVQLCASATGKPLTDDELRLIAGYPHQLALLFPGLVGVPGRPGD